MLYSLDMAPISNYGTENESPIEVRRQAAFLYSKAFSQGKWHAFWHKLRGEEPNLRDLSKIEKTAKRLSSKDIAVVNVPLGKIVGSEGRVKDFDHDFHPLADHNDQRWISVAAARRQGKPLPPVDLIQVGDEYYVRDGHHRISVAKASGQTEIEARIHGLK